ncbi:PAS domain S-box protein [Magnetococcus sp. PR-3]|uniref:PAS domain S-box protein n=1 Tax=Magnetococcus sp. PR-3 TaxID=3120355 RepID=UPI002FCE57EC
MAERKRVLHLIAILVLTTLLVGSVAIGTLYLSAFEQQRDRLHLVAQSQARLIESMAHFDRTHHKHPFESTFAQIKKAFKQFPKLGNTAEFTVGKKQAGQVILLLRHRHEEMSEPQQLSLEAGPAEPMRRAVQGRSGTVVGPDYKGVQVLAAYEPIAILNLGIVAKIDIQELRAPYIHGAMVAGLVAIVAILTGSWLFYHITNPLFETLDKQKRRQAQQRHFDHAIVSSGHLLYDWDTTNNSIQYTGSSEDILGYRIEELGSQPSVWRNLIHPDDLAIFDYQSNPQELATTATRCYRMRRKDGRIIWVEDSGAYPLQATESTSHLAGMIKDVTLRLEHEQTLMEAQHRAQSYLDTTQTMMVALNSQGHISMINQAGCHMLGYEASELLGKNWFEVCLPQPEGQQQVFPVFKQLLTDQTQTCLYHENHVICQNQSQRLIAWRNTPLRDHKGKIIGTLSSGEDITQRKRHEEQLTASEQRLSMAIRAGSMGIWAWDLSQNEITWDDRMFEIYALPKQSTISYERWEKCVVSSDLPRVKAVIQQAMDTHNEVQCHFRIQRQDGQIRHIFSAWGVMLSPQGKPMRMAGLNMDVTEQKQAQSHQYLSQLIFEHAQVAILVTDIKHQAVDMNEAFCQLTGYTHQEILAQTTPYFWVLNTQQTTITQALQTQGHWQGPVQLHHKDGLTSPCSIRISSIGDIQEQTIRYAVILSAMHE